MMETLKESMGRITDVKKYNWISVIRCGLTKYDTCEVVSEVLSNHLQLTVVTAIEQKNVQK